MVYLEFRLQSRITTEQIDVIVTSIVDMRWIFLILKVEMVLNISGF